MKIVLYFLVFILALLALPSIFTFLMSLAAYIIAAMVILIAAVIAFFPVLIIGATVVGIIIAIASMLDR